MSLEIVKKENNLFVIEGDFQCRETKIKTTTYEGEIYTRSSTEVKNLTHKDIVWRDDFIEFEFTEIEYSLKYRRLSETYDLYIPGYYCESRNKLVQYAFELFQTGLLDSRIKDMTYGRGWLCRRTENWESVLLNEDIDLSLFYYGSGDCVYTISVYDFLMSDKKNMKNSDKDFFERNGVCIEKLSPSERIIKFRKKRMDYLTLIDDRVEARREMAKINELNAIIEADKVIGKPKKHGKNTYLMKDMSNGFYKIGRSNNPKYREKTLQSEKPNIKLVKTWEKDIESELHKEFDHVRVRGEWFNLNKVQVERICKTY